MIDQKTNQTRQAEEAIDNRAAAQLQMATVDAAVPAVMLTTPKLPRLAGD